MATTSLARDLGSLVQGGSAAGLSDRQLIERFATHRDEAAFAALHGRHGLIVNVATSNDEMGVVTPLPRPIDDRRHRSGPDGRVTMFNLIPGARYRFRGREFMPEPDPTIDLGDVVIVKPPS
jgi:hypothetical protein